MFRGLAVSARKTLSEMTQHRSPGKIAIGAALGMSLGFLPVDNLVWVLLLVAVLFLPVHQVSAVAVWLATSLFSGQLAVIPNSLGDWLLSMDGVQWCVAQWHAVPLGAWFRLNNTLVVGSIALGLMILIPNWVVLRILNGRTKQQELHPLDELSQVTTSYRKSATPMSRVAIAGESLPQTKSLRVDPPHVSVGSVAIEEDNRMDPVTIRETFIEVVRLRAPQSPHFTPKNDRKDTMLVETKNASSSISNSSIEVDHQEDSSKKETIESMVTRYSPAHQQLSGPKSSNSLRFLLRHLTSHRHGPSGPESQA